MNTIYLNLQNLFRKKHKAAYSGDLMCPYCKSTKNKIQEVLSPYATRYKCRNCGLFYRYITTPERLYGDDVCSDYSKPYSTYPVLQDRLIKVKKQSRDYISRSKAVIGGKEYDVGVRKLKLTC